MSESRWRTHYKQAIRDGEARRLADSRTIARQIKRAVKAEAEADLLRERAEVAEADRDHVQAEADRLDEALATIAGISTATVMIDPALPLRIARAALDAEDGDGLAEIAHISEDADLYRKTEGIIIRREGESNACCS